MTPALRVLRAAGVGLEAHVYRYQRGGTAELAAALGVDERLVIKTLIMEDDNKAPCIVLMHGDREVATGLLARHIGVKRLAPCPPEIARGHSGYAVGGTSPFGTRRAMPIYCEASIAELPSIYINGGRRGLAIKLATADLLALLQPRLVAAAQPRGAG